MHTIKENNHNPSQCWHKSFQSSGSKGRLPPPTVNEIHISAFTMWLQCKLHSNTYKANIVPVPAKLKWTKQESVWDPQ
jgi:hypothetical protein